MPRGNRTSTVEIIAHRGYSAIAPENTLPAFEAAVAAGADAVELDVHLSADGVPVVLHDATLDRTTSGTGPVHAHTLAELKALDGGSWFSPRFAGTGVPTLAEALCAVGGRVERSYVEIKQGAAAADIGRILEVVRAAGPEDRCVLISFDWGALARLRALSGDVAIAYLLDVEARFPEALRRAAADPRARVDCDVAVLLRMPSLAADARRAGVGLVAYTVDEVAEARRLVALGVAGITTNRVAELVAAL